jgi:putative sterol carrier protein
VSRFKNADEVYQYMGKMFEMAVNEPQFVDATKDSGLVVRLNYSDPDSTILVDFPGRIVAVGSEAAAAGTPTVDLYMTCDHAHQFWLGRLNFPLAMAQRKVKMEGSTAKALKLLPLTKSLFAAYEQLLRDSGRDDLLQN